MQAQANLDFVVNVLNRSQLSMNGVLHIVSFDEDEITIMTREGKVHVEGNDLKVESLSKENGSILVIGEIVEITFEKEKAHKAGMLSKKKS